MNGSFRATLRTGRLVADCSGNPKATADIDTPLLEPDVQLARFEAHEAADPYERDPAFRHQPADMTRRDAEDSGNLVRVE
jgi:hypothetical protein